jgi:2-phosphosulfolactate phosphatase
MTSINLELVAADVVRAVQRQDIVIVVDVLRATSTIVTALVSGAQAIFPLESVEEARVVKRANPEYILAGEREGLKPSGFDLGNSPSEYTRERVQSRRIVFTTSSGTQALGAARDAPVVLVGSFLNATAVAQRAKQISKEMACGVTIALSGRLGEFSLEDFLCGGALVGQLKEETHRCSDAAYAAYLSYLYSQRRLLDCVLIGNHAKELVDLGLSEDVKFCCTLDKYDIVPTLQSGWIVRYGTV